MTQRHLDEEYMAVRWCSPNLMIPWYLMASYAYYCHDLSLVSDATYDEMAKEMLQLWDSLEHEHKSLITTADLEAGTLYRLKEDDYPLRVKGGLAWLVRHYWEMDLECLTTHR